jgi:hypothetical protein
LSPQEIGQLVGLAIMLVFLGSISVAVFINER